MCQLACSARDVRARLALAAVHCRPLDLPVATYQKLHSQISDIFRKENFHNISASQRRRRHTVINIGWLCVAVVRERKQNSARAEQNSPRKTNSPANISTKEALQYPRVLWEVRSTDRSFFCLKISSSARVPKIQKSSRLQLPFFLGRHTQGCFRQHEFPHEMSAKHTSQYKDSSNFFLPEDTLTRCYFYGVPLSTHLLGRGGTRSFAPVLTALLTCFRFLSVPFLVYKLVWV